MSTHFSAIKLYYPIWQLYGDNLQNRLKNIGKNIREYRKKLNLSQIELAVEVGIDRAYLSEIENGRTNTSINILYAISDALKIDITDLFIVNEN